MNFDNQKIALSLGASQSPTEKTLQLRARAKTLKIFIIEYELDLLGGEIAQGITALWGALDKIIEERT